jgi:predicted Zn-dependent protease with MMP-like domain
LKKSKITFFNLDNIYIKTFLILVIIIVGVLLRVFTIESCIQVKSKNLKNTQQITIINGEYQNLIEDKVLAFYNNLDQGNYKEAFKDSIEPVWEENIYFDRNLNVENNKVIGLRKTEELIERTARELGENGDKINIFNINIQKVVKINDYQNYYNSLQDIIILSRISEFKEVDNIFIIPVEGELFNCTFCGKIKWKKDFVIIKFRDEMGLKIFLNGSNNISGSYSTEWFVNRSAG